MNIFQNSQQFFNYIHSQCSHADDPTTPESARDKMYNAVFASIRTAAQWGKITPSEYRKAYDAVKMAFYDNDREQLDLLGDLK